MKYADAKNDAALIAKATFRPATAATIPPSDAPTASIADHIALDKAFAGSSSSAVVMLGMIAMRAGSKNADADTVSAMTTYAIHTWSALWMKRSPRMRPPRTRSVAIIR